MRHYLYKDQLRRLPDLQRLAKKFQRSKATLQDCYRVYQAIGLIPKLISSLQAYSGTHGSLLSELFINPVNVSYFVNELYGFTWTVFYK